MQHLHTAFAIVYPDNLCCFDFTLLAAAVQTQFPLHASHPTVPRRMRMRISNMLLMRVVGGILIRFVNMCVLLLLVLLCLVKIRIVFFCLFVALFYNIFIYKLHI